IADIVRPRPDQPITGYLLSCATTRVFLMEGVVAAEQGAVADGCWSSSKHVGIRATRSDTGSHHMKTLIATSAAAATLALGLATAPAQPRSEGAGAGLTPQQRSAIRSVLKERLADAVRDRIADRLADDAGGATPLTPAQRNAVRSAVQE